MTARFTSHGSFLLLAGLCAAAAPASAQYGGYGEAPLGYGPPPVYRPYNAPPAVGREYGRSYDDEYAPRGPRPLSARAVVDQLEDAGYEDVGRPRFTGTLYIVQVTGPAGVRRNWSSTPFGA